MRNAYACPDPPSILCPGTQGNRNRLPRHPLIDHCSAKGNGFVLVRLEYVHIVENVPGAGRLIPRQRYDIAPQGRSRRQCLSRLKIGWCGDPRLGRGVGEFRSRREASCAREFAPGSVGVPGEDFPVVRRPPFQGSCRCESRPSPISIDFTRPRTRRRIRIDRQCLLAGRDCQPVAVCPSHPRPTEPRSCGDPRGAERRSLYDGSPDCRQRRSPSRARRPCGIVGFARSKEEEQESVTRHPVAVSKHFAFLPSLLRRSQRECLSVHQRLRLLLSPYEDRVQAMFRVTVPAGGTLTTPGVGQVTPEGGWTRTLWRPDETPPIR